MAASASTSEITPDGPVLNLLNKRLRALRKKLNRVHQMEQALSQGKTLNKEQDETLRTKPSLLAAIDELEKLRLPLSQAVDQEIELALAERSKIRPDIAAAEETKTETKVAEDDNALAVMDLLNLLYFAGVFDVKTLMNAHDNMLTRTHERNCCLTYDYVTDDDASGDPLKEWDLDLVAMLGGLFTSRPVNSNLSHKNALQKCLEHAKLWLAKADQPIEPNSSITYAGLREKLNKIMGSDYFTTAPEIKAPVEVVAAGGNYTFQVAVHGDITTPTPASASVPIEGSSVEYQKEEEGHSHSHSHSHSPTSHADEMFNNDSGRVGEHPHSPTSHQEVESFSQVQQPQTEQDTEGDQDEFKEQFSRKQYQNNYNYRGRGGRDRGRRGGYGNYSRGGGRGYQNGHSQYFEGQPGAGYYPRNSYNYRGRGRRGGGGHAQATSS